MGKKYNETGVSNENSKSLFNISIRKRKFRLRLKKMLSFRNEKLKTKSIISPFYLITMQKIMKRYSGISEIKLLSKTNNL